jgi:hypothetical protein
MQYLSTYATTNPPPHPDAIIADEEAEAEAVAPIVVDPRYGSGYGDSRMAGQGVGW